MVNKTAKIDSAIAPRWYRERWPWLLMIGPVVVIIAGIYTAWLAVSTSDGLVSEDYYRQGLAAGATLARSQRAAELGISAGLRLTSDGVTLRLRATGAGWSPPASLKLTLSHPTRAGIDQVRQLQRVGETYAGPLQLPAAGHWLILLEDDANTWRILGSVMLPSSGETVIGAPDSGAGA